MGLLIAVEWTGTVLVVLSWLLVRYRTIWAPVASFAGACCWLYFGFAGGYYGVLALNSLVGAINVWTVWRWRKEDADS